MAGRRLLHSVVLPRRAGGPILGRLVLACLAVGAIAVGFLRVSRWPAQQPPVLDRSQHAAEPEPVIVETPHFAVQSDARDAERNGDRLGSLAEVSVTFRNTTFLIAIRDAGFVCDEVVAAHQTDADIWMARCRDVGSGYKIDVSETGELFVRPVAGYIDALAPILDDQFRLDRDAPLRLPPQPPRGVPR